MFKKILIANRGEIACRIQRTAQKLKIHSVGVYTPTDRSHLWAFEEAHCLERGYLDQESIIKIAKNAGAEAIHPGYGFLSENPDFAEACQKEGLIFIGPSSQSIRTMGLKTEAKALAASLGLPLIPGSDRGDLLKAAKDIGFPVLIKASAGGGGKGMRKVESEDAFLSALESCQREAKSSFGNEEVFLEKYIHHPRHIEVQIFGDRLGNAVHLYERDCSLQRRYQKIIEEAPAVGLSDEVRTKLYDYALRLAKGYEGAGTVEFLVTAEGDVYFMEMNTRLQVEHPVTEEITGIDLVEWQMLVAAGYPLPLKQNEISCKGHSLEVRLYAEGENFLPSTGVLKVFQGPSLGRIETSLKKDDVVTGDFDPMLAKYILWAENREDLLHDMEKALHQWHVVGVKHNLHLLQHIMGSSFFKNLDFHITTLDKDHTFKFPSENIIDEAAIALSYSSLPSPWNTKPYWRLSGHATAHIKMSCEGKEYIRKVKSLGNNSYEVDGRKVWLSSQKNIVIVGPDSVSISSFLFERTKEKSTNASQQNNSLKAPMTAKIIALQVKTNEIVQENSPLMILEAMKMEYTVRSPVSGRVTTIPHSIGDVVQEGTSLLKIDPL